MSSEPVIAKALISHLRMESGLTSIILPNVYMRKSPWEADVAKVNKTGWWQEYEIKCSVADFKADFAKGAGWGAFTTTKHQVYSSTGPTATGRASATHYVVPRKFYFVVPHGLLDGVDIPPHCGVMEYSEPKSHRRFGLVAITRQAPILKAATRLAPEDIFNLAVKASYRLGRQNLSEVIQAERTAASQEMEVATHD